MKQGPVTRRSPARLIVATIVAAGIALGTGLTSSGGSVNLHTPALALGPCPSVQNTPNFTIGYGTVALNGQPAPAGTVVEARSPRGDATGCFVVTYAGSYGAMYVYGEDTSVTPTIPGMRTGENVSFYVDSLVATASPTLGWVSDKDLHQVDLSASVPPPTAAFSGNPTEGLTPLAVQFADESTGNIDAWSWNFGDGGTGVWPSPVHTYTAAGAYTVTLTIDGPGGNDTLTKMDYITVVEGVQITLDPMAGGTLVYTHARGSSTVVQVPPGAVTETVALRYTPIPTVTNEPDSFHFAGLAFSLNVYRNGVVVPGYRFAQPVTITLNYAEDDITNLDEATLALHTWNGTAWVDAAESCTPASTYNRHPIDNWLSVAICHLSDFALFAKSPVPSVDQKMYYFPVIRKTGE